MNTLKYLTFKYLIEIFKYFKDEQAVLTTFGWRTHMNDMSEERFDVTSC